MSCCWMFTRHVRHRYNHNRLTRETRSKRTIAIVRAVVRNEVGYQEKLRQQAADIEAKEAAAAETGAEVQYDEPKFVTSIRDQMLAQSVPFQVAVKKQHRVTVTKNVQVTTDFVSAVHEVLQVQAANLRAELLMVCVHLAGVRARGREFTGSRGSRGSKSRWVSPRLNVCNVI